MIVVRSQYESLIDNLLDQFQMEDPKEIVLALEALQSITDRSQIHPIDDSFKERVKAIHSLIEKPPVEVKSEEKEDFKTLILMKVSAKIQLLSKKSLIKTEGVIPSFTDDAKTNTKIYEALIKLRGYELEQLAQEKGALQLYTPLEGRDDFDSTVRFDAFAKAKAFLEGSQRCLVLMGDAGAGKTTFAYHLAQTLWQPHEKGFVKDRPIPVLIPLITIGVDIEKKLLSEHFLNRGLSAEEILLLKKHLTFTFILEGYDERDYFKNLYQTNRLDEWRCQVITICRSQSLLNRRDDYRSYFISGQTNDRLQEIILCPFTDKEIKHYIDVYVKQQKDKIEWNGDLYFKTLSQLPAVLALVTNPFVLKMTVLALPQLVKKYEWGLSEKIDVNTQEKPLYEKMALTQAELYDAFIDAWFERQTKKLGDKLELQDGTVLTSVDFFRFNQEIATEMLRHKTKYLEFKEPQKQTTQSLLSSTSTTSTASDWQYAFFNPLSEKTTLLRSGWLLKKTGAKTYTFLHDSLRAHFAAKQLSHGILSHSSFALGHPLNDELIVDQPDLLDSLVDRVKSAPDLERLLFDLLESSKYEPFVAVGAANAITILNRAGIAFSGRNFSRVRIAGSDLSGAYLDGVNFIEADLRNVRFIEASLTEVNFTGACMDGIQFGQLPPLRFPNSVGSCTYSPDGKWLAVGDGQGYIYLVETTKRSVVATFKNWSTGQLARNDIYCLCFSSDSRWLVAGSKDGLIRLWNVSSKQLYSTFKGHTNYVRSVAYYVRSVAYSPDGKTVASGSDDLTVRLWEVATGKTLQTLKGHTHSVNSVAYSPDGKTLASGSHDKTVRLWEVATGKALQTLKRHSNWVYSVAFSPDGKTLASGSYDNTVRLWEVATGKALQTLQGHTYSVNCVAFSPDGKTLASGSGDKTVRLWEVATGKALQTFHGHTWNVHSVAFSPDGKTLASGTYDETVRLWEVTTGKALQTLQGHTSEVRSVAYSPDGKTLASGSYDKTVRLWEVATGKALQTLKRHSNWVYSVAFSPDGKTLASGSYDNTVRLWEVSTGKVLQTLHGHTDWVNSAAYSPNGKTLVSGSKDKTVRLWEVATGKALQTLQGHTSAVYSVAISPDGKTLASGSYDNTVRLWEVATGKALQTLQGHTNCVCSVAFSPDGKTLASGSYDNTVRLWEVATGKALQTLQGHTLVVNSVAYSPDGKTLASGSEDQTVRLWEVVSGQYLSVWKKFKGAINSIVWNPTGEELTTGDESGAVKRWHLPKDLKKEPPLLMWSSHGTQGLFADQSTITLVTGLSQLNLTLLQQHGATGQVFQKSSEDILLARDEMETVGDSCEAVLGSLLDGSPLGLRSNNWVVSLAHKIKDKTGKEDVNQHAFLILEGIENQKRVILVAEVFIDHKRQDEFQMPFSRKLGFGYAYVQIKPITSRDAKELAKQCHFRSEAINKKQVDLLQELIHKDAKNHDLEYSYYGNNKIFSIALGDKKYGNCLNFAEAWLKGAQVNFVNEAGWEKTFYPYTSQRAYLPKIPNDKKDNTSSNCLVQ